MNLDKTTAILWVLTSEIQGLAIGRTPSVILTSPPITEPNLKSGPSFTQIQVPLETYTTWVNKHEQNLTNNKQILHG